MKPSSGPRFGRQHFPVVYVTRFGKHPCGTKICSGGKSPPKKVAQRNLHSCLSDKASSATLDKRGPVGVAPQRERRHPSLGPGTVQVRGSQTGCRQPQSEGWSISMAKPPGRGASKLAPSRKKSWGNKKGAANSTISSGTQKCMGYQHNPVFIWYNTFPQTAAFQIQMVLRQQKPIQWRTDRLKLKYPCSFCE